MKAQKDMLNSQHRIKLSARVRVYLSMVLPTTWGAYLLMKAVVFLFSENLVELIVLAFLNLVVTWILYGPLKSVLNGEDVMLPLVYFSIHENSDYFKAEEALFIVMCAPIVFMASSMFRMGVLLLNS